MQRSQGIDCKRKKDNGNGDRSGSSNKKVRFKGKCSNCGQRGHKEVNCWQKEENADKQPNNWKQTSDVNVPNVETVMVCLETDNFEEKYSKRPTNDDWRNLCDQAATIFEGQPSKNDEFIGLVNGLFNNEHDAAVEWMSYWTIQENLRELENGSNISAKSDKNVSKYTFENVEQLTIPTSMDLLRSPYIWVCNTGASVHSTYNATNGINVRDGDDVTTIGQTGGATIAAKVLELKGTWYDKYGSEQLHAQMKNVHYNPSSNFNLFSIGAAIREGWRVT